MPIHIKYVSHRMRTTHSAQKYTSQGWGKEPFLEQSNALHRTQEEKGTPWPTNPAAEVRPANMPFSEVEYTQNTRSLSPQWRKTGLCLQKAGNHIPSIPTTSPHAFLSVSFHGPFSLNFGFQVSHTSLLLFQGSLRDVLSSLIYAKPRRSSFLLFNNPIAGNTHLLLSPESPFSRLIYYNSKQSR